MNYPESKGDPPDDSLSRTQRVWTFLMTYVTWPYYVHQLKGEGFRRVGWMTWEYDGSSDDPQ